MDPYFDVDFSFMTVPLLLGNLFGYGLYGVLVVQLFIYYHEFPKDGLWTKAMVWLVFLLDTAITVLGTTAAWEFLGKGWGHYEIIANLLTDWRLNIALPVLSAFVASIVQFFFAWRIWKLRKNLILPGIIYILALASIGMAIYTGIYARGSTFGLASNDNKLRPGVIAWLGGSVLVDTLITMSMVVILFKVKKATVFKNTSSRISKLITVTVETGMITAVTALVELIIFIVFPGNLHFLLLFMLAKLYSNALLASLNSRAPFGRGADNTTMGAFWDDDSTQLAQATSSAITHRDLRFSISSNLQTSAISRQDDNVEVFIIEHPHYDQYGKQENIA